MQFAHLGKRHTPSKRHAPSMRSSSISSSMRFEAPGSRPSALVGPARVPVLGPASASPAAVVGDR